MRSGDFSVLGQGAAQTALAGVGGLRFPAPRDPWSN